MSTQQDIYDAGFENRLPMLNKDNYVSWSSLLLRYEKSKPNGKLIYHFIMHGPYVRQMILEPGDLDREVLVAETFHKQTNEELTEKELKPMEADNQAIQTILMGHPEDIYAAVDSCETAQEIWHNVKNQNRYNAVQNVKNQVVQDAVQNLAARAGGNCNRNNRNQIRCHNCRGIGHLARNCTVRSRRRDAAYLQTQLLIAQTKEEGTLLQAVEFALMAAVGDLDDIKEFNANCILMANLQQISTSSTQTNKALIYDSDGSAEVHHYDNCYNNNIFNMFTQEEQYTEILYPITEPHIIQQNNSNIIFVESTMEHNEGTVEQHPATVEETRANF
nr:hypothetical protein [Tanacetum cinerariifolium]